MSRTGQSLPLSGQQRLCLGVEGPAKIELNPLLFVLKKWTLEATATNTGCV